MPKRPTRSKTSSTPTLDAETLRLLLERIRPIMLMGRAVQGERIVRAIEEMIREAECLQTGQRLTDSEKS